MSAGGGDADGALATNGGGAGCVLVAVCGGADCALVAVGADCARTAAPDAKSAVHA